MRLFRGRGPEWGSHQIRQSLAASLFAILMRDAAERQVGPGLAGCGAPACPPCQRWAMWPYDLQGPMKSCVQERLQTVPHTSNRRRGPVVASLTPSRAFTELVEKGFGSDVRRNFPGHRSARHYPCQVQACSGAELGEESPAPGFEGPACCCGPGSTG